MPPPPPLLRLYHCKQGPTTEYRESSVSKNVDVILKGTLYHSVQRATRYLSPSSPHRLAQLERRVTMVRFFTLHRAEPLCTPPAPPSPPTPPTPPHSFVHWIWFSPPPQHENRHKEKDSSRDRRLSAVAAAVARDNKHGTNHNPLLAHPHGSSHIHTLIAYDVDISMPPSRSRT